MPAEMDLEERRELRRKARTATLDALRALGGEASRRHIARRVLAEGGFTPRERTAPPPADKADKHATHLDYELSWTLTNLKRDGLVENPRWGMWRLADGHGPVLGRLDDRRRAELSAMSYDDYLWTSEWQHQRDAALHRAGGRCSLDAAHAGPLDVHHRRYGPRGEEPANDLIVLCRSCHGRHHQTPAPEAPPAVVEVGTEQLPVPSLWRRLLARG